MPKLHRWKAALTSIIEELSEDDYTKMLEYLEKIPRSKKTSSRSGMAQIIIECYGEKKSISKIKYVMKKIPRNDHKVQELLQPFLKKQGGNKENKRIHETDSEEEDKDEDDADGRKNPQTEKERKLRGREQSIQDLKIRGYLSHKVVVGKVVQKSGLRPCRGKEKNSFFYMGLSDETGCIRVRVFGKEHFEYIEEEKFYNFTNIMMDEKVMIVNRDTRISQAATFKIPKDLDLIISNSPVRSIREVLNSAEKTAVSVEGTVKKIGKGDTVTLQKKRTKKDILRFQLEDDTGDIWITLWGDDISQLRGTSVGDWVRVMNLKTSCFRGVTSLNSTDSTTITQVLKARRLPWRL